MSLSPDVFAEDGSTKRRGALKEAARSFKNDYSESPQVIDTPPQQGLWPVGFEQSFELPAPTNLPAPPGSSPSEQTPQASTQSSIPDLSGSVIFAGPSLNSDVMRQLEQAGASVVSVGFEPNSESLPLIAAAANLANVLTQQDRKVETQ